MADPLDIMKIRQDKCNHTFGMVRRRRNGKAKAHQGWDLEANAGDPVRAVADGTIVSVRKKDSGAYGLYINLKFQDKHGNTYYAFYAHLKSINVRKNQKVSSGDKIGEVGRSGNLSRGIPTHLHFEIRTIANAGRGLKNRKSPFILFGDNLVKDICKRN